MKKWTKGTMPFVVIAMVALLAMTSYAQNMGGGMGRSMGSLQGLDRLVKNPKVVEELALTDAQVDSISAISKQAAKKKIRIQADVQILQIDLVDLIEQDNPDTSKIDSIIEQIGEKNTESQKLMIHTLLDMKKVFTAEQLDKIKEFMAQRGSRQGKRNGAKGGNMEHRKQGGMMQPQDESESSINEQ